MQRFTDAGRAALENKNWYAALTIALALPDVCGSLEDPGPSKSQRRYVAWCRKWLEPKFTSGFGASREEKVWFSAEDCYQARCSIIHSGSALIPPNKQNEITRFEFFSSGSHMNECGGGTIDDVPQPVFLQLRVDRFCETVFDAVEEWDGSVIENEAVQGEKAKLLIIRQPGDVISGIKFGLTPAEETKLGKNSRVPDVW